MSASCVGYRRSAGKHWSLGSTPTGYSRSEIYAQLLDLNFERQEAEALAARGNMTVYRPAGP